MDNIDQSLNRLVQKGNTPSVQYLLFNGDQILHQYRAGFADVAKQRKTDEHTAYHAFSVTKTFTALAVLQLAEQGKLDLEKPAASYIENFPYSDKITVRHLLSHSAGIPNPNPLPWIHLYDEHQAFDSNAFFSRVFAKHSKVKSPPNEKFAYTNLGYVLLGQLIAQLSGKSFETYIHDHVLKPLELGPADIGFGISDSGIQAKGYHRKNSLMNWIIGFFIDKKKFRGPAEGIWQPFLPHHINGASYGGLVGTPMAFMKYAREILNEDCKLISSEFKQVLLTENYTVDKKPTGMSLSWFTGELDGNSYFAHAGGGGGFYCELRLYPEKGIGSVIMFNRSGMRDERILDKLDHFWWRS